MLDSHLVHAKEIILGHFHESEHVVPLIIDIHVKDCSIIVGDGNGNASTVEVLEGVLLVAINRIGQNVAGRVSFHKNVLRPK
jgi:hypothetical protein